MEKLIKLAVSVSSAYMSLLYPSHLIFGALIFVNILDYITGILRAVSMGEKIDIEMAWRGIAKKINKFGYVLGALTADILIVHHFSPEKAVSPVSASVITWLIINELISVCSNVSNNNSLDIPPMLTAFFEKFKGGDGT